MDLYGRSIPNTFRGDVLMQDDLTVQGELVLEGGIDITGDIKVGGDATVDGKLNVDTIKEITADTFSLQNSLGNPVLGIINTNEIKIDNSLTVPEVKNGVVASFDSGAGAFAAGIRVTSGAVAVDTIRSFSQEVPGGDPLISFAANVINLDAVDVNATGDISVLNTMAMNSNRFQSADTDNTRIFMDNSNMNFATNGSGTFLQNSGLGIITFGDITQPVATKTNTDRVQEKTADTFVINNSLGNPVLGISNTDQVNVKNELVIGTTAQAYTFPDAAPVLTAPRSTVLQLDAGYNLAWNLLQEFTYAGNAAIISGVWTVTTPGTFQFSCYNKACRLAAAFIVTPSSFPANGMTFTVDLPTDHFLPSAGGTDIYGYCAAYFVNGAIWFQSPPYSFSQNTGDPSQQLRVDLWSLLASSVTLAGSMRVVLQIDWTEP